MHTHLLKDIIARVMTDTIANTELQNALILHIVEPTL